MVITLREWIYENGTNKNYDTYFSRDCGFEYIREDYCKPVAQVTVSAASPPSRSLCFCLSLTFWRSPSPWLGWAVQTHPPFLCVNSVYTPVFQLALQLRSSSRVADACLSPAQLSPSLSQPGSLTRRVLADLSAQWRNCHYPDSCRRSWAALLASTCVLMQPHAASQARPGAAWPR